MGAQTVHAERFQYGGPGQLWVAPAGTWDDTFAPTAVGGKFVQGTAAGDVPGNTVAIPMGDFGSPVQIDYTITAEELDVENSYEVVANIITKRAMSLRAELVDFTLWQYQVAMNAAASAWSGAPSATTVAKFTPPVIGSEVRWQLLWQSQDSTDLVLIYQALQAGAVSERRGKGAAGRAALAVEFKAELPPAATSTTLFHRFRCGLNAVAATSADV